LQFFCSKQKLTQHSARKRPCVEINKIITENVVSNDTVNITVKGYTLTQLIALLGENNIISFDRNTQTKPVVFNTPVIEIKPIVEPVVETVIETKPAELVVEIVNPVEPVVETKQIVEPVVETLIINKIDIDKYIEIAKELNNNIIDTRSTMNKILDRKQRKTKETNQMSDNIIQMTKKLCDVKKALRIAGCDIKKIQFKKEIKEPDKKPEREPDEDYGECKFTYNKR
jgi:hypothetical protein